MMHKVIWMNRVWHTIRRTLGDTQAGVRAEQELAYWMRSQLGDPGDVCRPALRALAAGTHDVLVCGHSHLPGVVTLDSGRRYANTGSWTFKSSTYLRLEGDRVELRDWISGREHDDRLYRPILDQEFDHVTFDDWWDAQYMGLLRFRCGEELSARRPPWLDRRPALEVPLADDPPVPERSAGK